MSKQSSGNWKKKRSRPSKPTRRLAAQTQGASATRAPDEPLEDDGELLVAAWRTSRAGARAGRGFHFQDAVGAWLAARIASGESDADSITPEGLEDLVLEGTDLVHLQVKSRIERLGSFPVRVASHHILDAWQRHCDGAHRAGRLVVVLERGVEGEEGLSDADSCLADATPPDSQIRRELATRARQRDISEQDIAELFRRTTVLGTSWDRLTLETADSLAAVCDLVPSARRLVGRELRTLVADAVDANADSDYGTRRTLTRTELVSEIARFASHIDLDALEAALRDGICEPFELTHGATPDDMFYEGVATQPMHVQAGLVVPRPDVVGEVLAGLSEKGAVVVAGPSGVGKSAVLWTVPLARPGVLWFRVRHLDSDDAPALVRLARAYGCTESTPVGFLVDGAGVGEVRGWARLRVESASVPGMLLVATARSEDLATLGDLSGCATVSVHLNEAAAEVIFRGLQRRGSTAAPHWREAFERSHGLTLEYTHILTRGRRLSEVIDEQIERRVDEGRLKEVEVLSLVSVADQWTASLSSDALATSCGESPIELRQTLRRLVEEHLLTERDGVVSGLHRLRSEAIASAIHAQPPPALMSTLRRVLELVSTPQLHRFIANVLRDEPGAAEVIIEAAGGASADVERVTAYLHGLRLADFHDLASEWTAVAAKYEVPASSQPILFQFAAAGLTFPEFFPQPIQDACGEMSAMSGPTRAAQAAAVIGYPALATLLVNCSDLGLAARLLSTMDGIGSEVATAVASALVDGCALHEALMSCTIEDLGDCLAAARACDPELATLLVAHLGGQAANLERLRASDPWILDLDVHSRDVEDEGGGVHQEAVGYCRFLHVSDKLHADARQRAISLGRHLLRCLPSIDCVDVQALLPGGHELQIGDYTHGVSGLRRRYDHSTLTVSWNQARLRSAVTLLGAPDNERLASASPLLAGAVDVLREIGQALVLGRSAPIDWTALEERVKRLHETARELKPSLGAVEVADTALGEEAAVPMGDDLSALLTDVTGNIVPRLAKGENHRALAAYIAETTLARHLAGAKAEPWYLVGLDGHPANLDTLGEVLSDLHAIVHEMATDGADLAKVGRSARSGGRDGALRRAADTCRRSEQRRRQARRDALERLCRTTGLRTSVLRPSTGELPSWSVSWAVTVDLESLAVWPAALEGLLSKLGDQQPLGETYVCIPLRARRPVPSFAMTLIKTPLPSTSIDDWLPQLGAPHPSELADAFSEGLGALQTLSGMCDLADDHQSHHAVQEAAEAALEEYERSHATLLAFPADPLTQELLSLLEALAVQVQAEVDGVHDGETVSSQIAAGVVQGATGSVFDTIVGARVLALEWDVDRELAVELFEAS